MSLEVYSSLHPVTQCAIVSGIVIVLVYFIKHYLTNESNHHKTAVGVSNRTWYQRHLEPNMACPKKYIGQMVLIHAGADKRGGWTLNNDQAGALYRSKSVLYSTDFDNLHFGSVIGCVEIVGCVQNHPSVWAEQGVYNWVLANPVLFEKPIPAKGKLSFWNFDGVIEEGGKP